MVKAIQIESDVIWRLSNLYDIQDYYLEPFIGMYLIRLSRALYPYMIMDAEEFNRQYYFSFDSPDKNKFKEIFKRGTYKYGSPKV